MSENLGMVRSMFVVVLVVFGLVLVDDCNVIMNMNMNMNMNSTITIHTRCFIYFCLFKLPIQMCGVDTNLNYVSEFDESVMILGLLYLLSHIFLSFYFVA